MFYSKKMEDSQNTDVAQYQVYVNDISWNANPVSFNYQKKREYSGTLPKQLTFDVPLNVIEQLKKNPENQNDIIESFIYSVLTRKFMHEVLHCQIWILF